MSYLLDKKNQRKKIFYILIGFFVLSLFFYFRVGILSIVYGVSQKIFYPVLQLGKFTNEKINNIGGYFAFKNSLLKENQKLRDDLMLNNAKVLNYDVLLQENLDLKEILERKNLKKNFILASVLSVPGQSPYDTLLLDAGEEEGIILGKYVFAYGDIPVGYITEVYSNTSKVVLFSNKGERTHVLIPGKVTGEESGMTFFEVVGRGGGNFEMILPRDLKLQKGDKAIMPGINPYVIAVTDTVISDPRDPFTKALLVSPLNIQELNFVQVES